VLGALGLGLLRRPPAAAARVVAVLAPLAALFLLGGETVSSALPLLSVDFKSLGWQLVIYSAALPLALRASGDDVEAALFLGAVLGMGLIAAAGNLPMLFIGLEFMSLPAYLLVARAGKGDSGRRLEAALKYFFAGALAGGLFLLGMALYYSETRLLGPSLAPVGPLGQAGVALMASAALFKIGAVPLHSWIPDTYQGAPTPITAYLSIAPKGAAFAILLRIFFATLIVFKPQWVWLMIGTAILSMLYGNIVAIAQKNIKRMLAYSGIAQIGNLLIGMATGTTMGAEAVLFYLLTYLFANLGAFAVIIAFSQTSHSDEIEDYSGLSRRSPFLAFAMLIFLLSLAGVPPLAGFIGKIYVFAAAIKEELYTLITVGLISIVISLYYYIIVVKKMYINEPADPSPIPVPEALKAVIYVCLAGTLILGMWPQPFMNFAVSAASIFSGMSGDSAVATILP